MVDKKRVSSKFEAVSPLCETEYGLEHVINSQVETLSLARACYRNADIYLLDDPLSALNAHVRTHIFDECIGPKGFLTQMDATRILVTHQTHFLDEADWIVILNDVRNYY